MGKSYYVVPIFVPHLGCPHDCIFCNQKRISGIKAPLNSGDLHREIESILSTLDYSNNPRVEIAFFGGSFTGIELALQEDYLSIGKTYIDKGLVDGLRLSTRPDYIDETILRRLKQYGVETIELGVQSMHQDVLEASNRGHTVASVVQASKMIKDYGFTLGHQLMPGLPGDTVERFKETVDLSVALGPDVMRFYPTLVIKETGLADAFCDKRYEAMSLEEATCACAYGLEKCLNQGIRVIRIGLQATESVCDDGDVLAGPFHPSFRQLVEGMVFKKKVVEALKILDVSSETCKGQRLRLTCSANQVSSVSGLNKRNKLALIEAYGFSKINIIGADQMAPYTIMVEVF